MIVTEEITKIEFDSLFGDKHKLTFASQTSYQPKKITTWTREVPNDLKEEIMKCIASVYKMPAEHLDVEIEKIRVKVKQNWT